MFSIKPPLMFGTAASTTKRREFVAVSAEDKKCPVSYPAGRQRRWTTMRKPARQQIDLGQEYALRAAAAESRRGSPNRKSGGLPCSNNNLSLLFKKQ